jgi:hypothetical protein
MSISSLATIGRNIGSDTMIDSAEDEDDAASSSSKAVASGVNRGDDSTDGSVAVDHIGGWKDAAIGRSRVSPLEIGLEVGLVVVAFVEGAVGGEDV